MKNKKKWMIPVRLPFLLSLFLSLIGVAGIALGTTDTPSQGMTLWDIIRSGGVVMVLLGLLSLFMTALVLYLLFHLNPKKLVPEALAHDLIQLLKKRDYNKAKAQCLKEENIISTIVLAGIEKCEKDSTAAQEAIELTARQEVIKLWNSIQHLGDIAQIAPMLGLLGTVLGMIRAFNAIAFETAIVKPILLAGGVSQAMVTTAGGLSLGILAILCFSFFRTRVQYITQLVETHTSEILDALKR